MSQWDKFAYFVKSELRAGGPDPQLDLLLHMGQKADAIETMWLIGCYGAHHCVPSAYAVWRGWRPHEVHDPKFEQWLADHWGFLPVRPEMRSHRMVHKRARCLRDFADYALGESWRRSENFDTLWAESTKSVLYYGRYMAIKVLEFMHRSIRPDARSYNIQAAQAWSPRITLAQLFPEHELRLTDRKDNSQTTVGIAEELANLTIERLRSYDVRLSHFQLQVLLCEYREACEGTFYPGAGHDEELTYAAQVGRGFLTDDLFHSRAALFLPEFLGEIGGWDGIRKSQYQVWKDRLALPDDDFRRFVDAQ